MKHARSDYNERIQDSAGLIPDDEPVLLIRGQDNCALAAGWAWVRAAYQVGVDRDLIQSIERHLRDMEAWQAEHGAKVPGAPEGVLA